MRGLALALLALGALAMGCGSPPATSAAAVPTASSGTAAAQVALPARVDIPAIHAAGDLIALGLDPDGSTAEPSVHHPEIASWYKLGPRPGALGPALILGHVNGDGRPGVFARLNELKTGALVKVTREDASVATFQVYRTQQVAKSAFPTQEVYNNTDGPELRLVTCTGSFDESRRSYRDSFIAYAKLIA